MFDKHPLKVEIRDTARLSFPLVIANSAQIVIALINTIMMGHLGVQSLAAGGLAVILYITFFLICVGLTQGVSIYVSHAFPKNQYDQIAKIVANGIYVGIILSCISMFILWRVISWLNNIVSIEHVAPISNAYLHAVLWGFMPAVIFTIFRDFFAAISRPLVMTIIASIMIPFVLLLNYLLIYGQWGFPRLGVVGIGWSTTIISNMMLLLTVLFLGFSARYRHYRFLYHLRSISIKTMAALFRIGLPIAIMFGLQFGVLTLSSVLTGHIGTEALAANQILNQYLDLVLIFPLGISLATTVRVGYAYGVHDWEKIKYATQAGILLSLLSSTVVAICFWCFGRYLALVFLGFGKVKSDNTLSLAVAFLAIGGVYQLFRALQVTLNATLRSLEDTFVPMLIGFISYWGIGVTTGVLAVFYFRFNIVWLWGGLSLGACCAVSALFYRLRSMKKNQWINMPLIKPITLGKLTLNCNLLQGPLAGYSCAPFRLIAWRYGKPGFSTTEMISANTLVNHPKLSRRRYTWKDPEEGPVCFQLSGTKPKEIALATKIVSECGADLIDLNCGCPKPKIRGKGAGSKHLANHKLLRELIRAIKDNTDAPVSIKIRVDGDSGEDFNDEIVQAVDDACCDFLVVHGRHWKERYDAPCRIDEIMQFVRRVSIPVIGNGDIDSIESLKQMFESGCVGVMVSRASVGRPWLFAKLKAEMNNKKFVPPSVTEIGDIFINHIQRLSALINNEKFAVFQARKLGKYYSKNISNRTMFCEKLNDCDNLSHFIQLIKQFFNDRPSIR